MTLIALAWVALIGMAAIFIAFLSPTPCVMQPHRTRDDYAKAGLITGGLLGAIFGASAMLLSVLYLR